MRKGPSYTLAQRYSKTLLLTRAAETDQGFDLKVYADMLGTLSRFSDDELPIDGGLVHALRGFFTEWATELRT